MEKVQPIDVAMLDLQVPLEIPRGRCKFRDTKKVVSAKARKAKRKAARKARRRAA